MKREENCLPVACFPLLSPFLAKSFFAITAKMVEVGAKCLSEDPPKIGPAESFKHGLKSLRSAVFEIQAISLFFKIPGFTKQDLYTTSLAGKLQNFLAT